MVHGGVESNYSSGKILLTHSRSYFSQNIVNTSELSSDSG